MVEELGEKFCACHDGGADATRSLHVGDRLLDCGGGDQDLTVAANSAAILRMKRYATRAQEIKSFAVASLVERAVRTLDKSTSRLDDQCEGSHAATADATKKVISTLGHGRNLQALAMRDKLDWGAGMSRERCKIGVVAPASRMSPDVATSVSALGERLYPDRTPEIVFHSQCFASHGHFAGDDEARVQAFLDIANDGSYNAVWFARGGYGSCRVVESIMSRLIQASRGKAYVGYSDAGMLLAALYRAGFTAVAHGPVAQDILRDGGDAAVARTLAWMIDRAPEALEPTVDGAKKTAAFNMTVLSHLLGTPLEPDLDGHVLMLEEVGEAM